MPKTLVALAATLFILLAGSTGPAQAGSLRPQVQPAVPAAQSGGSKLSPDVLAALKSMPAGDMLTVIVTLTEQTPLSQLAATPPGANRAARLKNVIEQLQTRANISQRALKVLLNQRRAEGRVGQVEYLWIINGLAVTATPDIILELAARPEVASISANATLQAPPPPPQDVVTLAVPEANLQLVNAPAMWNLGYTGQGIVIGYLDTGVDIAYHQDLASSWRGGSNSWFDPYHQNATPNDLHGHGTWTMGVTVGGQTNGRAYGLAPDAQWIAAKIFNNSGFATVLAIHQALQWVLDPDGDPNTPDAPHVLNNSWTWTAGCDYEFRTALQNIRAAGILPIFAAGNNPSATFSPANYPEAFAVGAVDNSDIIYSSSSRGPSACDGTTYPEIVAPGVNIYTTDLFGMHYNTTGTSLAAPHVAGALALLLSASPQLTVDEQEAALLNGVVDLGSAGPDNTYGHGRLNVLASLQSLGDLDLAVTQTASPNPVVVDRPLHYTISVANNGPALATGVTLTNTLVSGVTVGQVSTSQGGCSVPGSGDIVCTLGALPVNGAATVTLIITPTTSGITLTNTSTAAAAELDYNVKNNVSVANTPVLTEAPFKTFLPMILK